MASHVNPTTSPLPHASLHYIVQDIAINDMPPVPPEAPIPPLSSFDGPFQLAEFLSLKVRHDPHDIKGLVEVPTDSSKAADKHVWIYEHLRRIPIDVTPLVTQLLTICNRETCPEMKADEWQYLCVAHDGDGANRCCAIDYILHALDSTTALLSSSSYFPSRLQIPHASLAHFPSLFRRLSRIFSHSYFHHREAFATAEAETSIYARFVALCERYELVGSNLLIIPQEGYEVLSHDDDIDDHHDDDDEEEADWDDDASADSGDHDEDYNGENSPRGREKDEDGSLGRSHSLGRHPAPSYQSPGKWTSSPVQPANKGKPAPAQASESLSPPSTRAMLDGKEETEEQPPPTIPPGKGRGTLSRGKTPRSANLWNADDMPGDKPAASEAEGAEAPQMGMARKESVDSVVYVGKDGEEEGQHLEEAAAKPSEEEDKPEAPAPVVPEAQKEPTSEEKSEPAKVEPTPTLSSETTASDAQTSPTASSEPQPIPQTSNKPRTPPNKLMTPPKPPAAASPGKSSPAPAQASPTLMSPPKQMQTLSETVSESAKAVPEASTTSTATPTTAPAEQTEVVDLGISPKTVVAALPPSSVESTPATVETAKETSSPATETVTPPSPVEATSESSSLEVPQSSDSLSAGPKSELQAKPGGSPKSINKRNSKNKRGKKGNGPPPRSPGKSED